MKYLAQALEEYYNRVWSPNQTASISDIRLQDLVAILRRAQQLKDDGDEE